jgi:hypothetical protein
MAYVLFLELLNLIQYSEPTLRDVGKNCILAHIGPYFT